MFCPQCGYKNEDSAKFCKMCGTPLSKPNSPMASDMENAKSEPKIASEVKTKMSLNKKIILIIVTVIFLLGLGVGTYFIITHQQRVRANEAYIAQISAASQAENSKNYDTAITDYQAAIQQRPDDVKAYIGLADAYIGKKDYDNAAKILQTGYSKTQSEILKEKLTEVQNTMKDKQTEQEYNKQLTIAKECIDKKNYDNAISAYQKALNIYPQKAELYLGIANAYSSKSNYEQAISILQKGYDKTQSTEIQLKLSELEKEQQILLLKEFAEKAPSSCPNWKTLIKDFYSDQGISRWSYEGAIIVNCSLNNQYALIESYNLHMNAYSWEVTSGYDLSYESVYVIQNNKVVSLGSQNLIDEALRFNCMIGSGNGGKMWAKLVKNKDDGKYYYNIGRYEHGGYQANDGYDTYYKVNGNILKQIAKNEWADVDRNGQCTFNNKPIAESELSNLKVGPYQDIDTSSLTKGGIVVLN